MNSIKVAISILPKSVPDETGAKEFYRVTMNVGEALRVVESPGLTAESYRAAVNESLALLQERLLQAMPPGL